MCRSRGPPMIRSQWSAEDLEYIETPISINIRILRADRQADFIDGQADGFEWMDGLEPWMMIPPVCGKCSLRPNLSFCLS